MSAGDNENSIKDLAMKGDVKIVIGNLKNILGERLTTLLSGKSDASIIRKWIGGEEKPADVEELRLRYGYYAAALIEAEFDSETARAIFIGSNTYLDDEALVMWLRHHEKEEDLKEVVSATWHFIDGGFS